MSDTVDPEVAAREELAKREEEADTKWLMGSEAGRRVVWELLEFAGVFRTSPTMDNWTFFNEGQRNVGLKLLGRIQAHCPDEYALMIKEHRDE
jgi:hypothetical protein